LIGALSGWKYHERRECCLATWMADADRLGLRSLFLLGCPTAAQPELIGRHALACPCPDDYPSLPQRTLWFCRWALSAQYSVPATENSVLGTDNCVLGTQHSVPSPPWDYLFKCDDDTYVSIPRLVAYAENELHGRDYVGAEWRPGAGYGSGGAGYFLSRKAAAILDMLVGQILRAAGLPLSIEPRLIPFGSMEHRPRQGNDRLTVHGVKADAFLAAHRETGQCTTTDCALGLFKACIL
jgi:hypothetical protein